uniref:Uncharacterized protein n=1 Tax=Mimivirus LCMiAC02 TaxID=2506609 RepID=A0A481Z1L9_9VIRU|nr:MAG: hypothetical protein LCMiAC02_00800 [Mimivirus LCMiAC02]
MDTKSNNTESNTTESKTTGSKTTESKTTESVTTESVTTGTETTGSVTTGTETTGSETTGTETTGTETTGTKTTGSETTGSETTGTETTGSETTGTETTGTDTTGSETTGSENTGSENTGSETTESKNTGSETTESKNTGSETAESKTTGSKKTKTKKTKKIKNTKNTKNTKTENIESKNNTTWSIYKSKFSADVSLGEASLQELAIGSRLASKKKKSDWGRLVEYKEKWREIWEPLLKILEQLYKTLQTLEGKDYELLNYVLRGSFRWNYHQRKNLWKAISGDVYSISDTLCHHLREAKKDIDESDDGEYKNELSNEFDNLVNMLGEKSIITYEYIHRETGESRVGRKQVEDMTQRMRQAVNDIKTEYEKKKED